MSKPGCSEAEIAKAKKLADELDEATDKAIDKDYFKSLVEKRRAGEIPQA